MKWTQNHIFTLRDAPADAEITSHRLLARGGYIKKLMPGVFTFQNLALRALRKIENIIREELDSRGCTEVLMPMVQPQELWVETGRLDIDELLKFKNRNGHGFCLGPTHEEVVTDIIRSDVKSYRDLPRNLYQIQTKYRDEIRPRFGLMRGREFIMKDAYSFDKDMDGAKASYKTMYEAYRAIFDRLGLAYRIVEADPGNIGGSLTQEFQVLAEAGEDHLMYCDSCDFAANIEVAPAKDSHIPDKSPAAPMEEFATPGLKQISTLSKALSIAERDLVKTMFYDGGEGQKVAVLLRGNDQVNPIKLRNAMHFSQPPRLLDEQEVNQVTGAYPGSCGPVGLKIPVILDASLEGKTNMVVGANKNGFHFKNVNSGRDFKIHGTYDVRLAAEGDICPKCKTGKYKSARGIEVGHIFYLGNKYSKAMGANFLNPAGEQVPIEMGCYGIGVSRTMQAAVEQNHDVDGIIWPTPIAPVEVHVCLLDIADAALVSFVDKTVKELKTHGVDALVDDRDERPGVKFKDADLLGMPVRLTIGKKGFDQGIVELVVRKGKELKKVPLADAVSQTLSVLKSQGFRERP